MLPLLLAISLPALGALMILRRDDVVQARRIAILTVAFGTLGAGLPLVWQIIHTTEHIVPGATSAGAITGAWQALVPVIVSVIGIVAVAMTPIAGLASSTLARMLLVHVSSVALVMTRNPFVIALMWTASLLPVWLELRSGKNSKPAARVFLLYSLPSAACVLVGVSMQAQALQGAFILLALGIAIRQAVLPLHSWFLPFVQNAPLGMVVMFAVPQLGVLTHLHLLGGHLGPGAGHIIALGGAVTAVMASLLGVVQHSMRRALGFLIISQSGLMAFGLEATSVIASTGTLLMWIVMALAMAGFTMAIAALEARRGALDISVPNGNFSRTPMLATAFLLLGFATVGLPGTLGFVAEDLLVQGSVDRFPIRGMSLIVATAFNGITVMKSFFALFCGTPDHNNAPGLTVREKLALNSLLVLLVLAGLWPRLLPLL